MTFAYREGMFVLNLRNFRKCLSILVEAAVVEEEEEAEEFGLCPCNSIVAN